MGHTYEQNGAKNRINALHTAFNIIGELRTVEQVGVSQLADRLDMPKSTAHVYLRTLEEEGYLVNEDGEYRLSLRFLEVGGETRQRSSIYQTARPEIDELSAETGEVANLGVEERGERVLLYTSEPSEGMFDNSPTGQYTHIHWTALGKALLAQLPDERIQTIVSEYGLPKATENTITDEETLFAELEKIRERGYSVEDEERREGIKAVAVPVGLEQESTSPSAVSISGPKRRIGENRVKNDLLDAIKDTVNVIQIKYKHY